MGIKETLSTLIGFRTVSGKNGEIKKAYGWVREQLNGLPLFFYEYEFNGVSNMVITTKENQKNPKVWLAAHMDVVAGAESVWQPREADGKLYGRGAHDMKFAIACYIELLKELGSALSEYDLGIMLTGDEEVGGENGTVALLNAGYRGGVVFLPDGGGVWRFEEAAKGDCKLTITANGKPMHASRPWLGKSATHSLLRFLLDLENICAEYWRSDEDEHWHLTHTITMMSGGAARNQVAGEASAFVDVRFTNAEEYADFRAKLKVAEDAHPRVAVTEERCTQPYAVLKAPEAIQAFARLAEKAGVTCGWARAHGSSDAAYFTQFGIPTILIWPNAGGLHSEQEWIDLVDLERYYGVMKNWVQETAKKETEAPAGIVADPELEKTA